MKLLTIRTLLLIGALQTALSCAASVPSPTSSTQKREEKSVVAVVQTYFNALNAGDRTTIMSLYTADGVFMPQHIPAVVGLEKIDATYRNIFAAIGLDFKFTVDEAHVTGNWAWVRTSSIGTITIRANGESHPDGNQEFFLLNRKAGQDWKIARYIFTSARPRSGS